MTRQIIDIGANANDGTGEPLRQAFQAVNDNFANVWAAGPVDSQVVISNNVITTNVDNLELILAGNGIGTVTVESTVVPMIDSVYDLGSNDKKFDSVYARYFYGNGRYLTGISGGGGTGGNVYFSMNPPLDPNIGDIWIDSDSAVQYLYFNDNTSNQWAEMEAYQTFSAGGGTGNVDLTSVNSDINPEMTLVYSIGNVTNQWANICAVSIFSDNYLYANGAPISGKPVGGNTEIQFNNNGEFGASPDFTYNTDNGILSVTGNVEVGSILTDNYFYANGSPFDFERPAGSNTQIQFNNNNDFGASANLTYNTDVNQLQLDGDFRIDGRILAPSHANITMQVYGSWGGGNYYNWTFDNLGRLVLPTVTNPENGTILADSANLTFTNTGNVVVSSNDNAWLFSTDANLSVPAASVESTPVNPGFANQTQKSIKGSIETVAGNPLPSYTNTLAQSEIIWTATNFDVTAARMTLRIQYGAAPMNGIEMCDVLVAKEWDTNSNISYVVSNRLRTNNTIDYANVTAGIDITGNLIISVTNSSGSNEYYSYSITEFNRTND